MEALIYLKALGLFLTFFVCGFIITRRVCSEIRIQILLPTAVITGIAAYIFFLNLIAFAVKGPAGFYMALLAEVLLAYFFKVKIKPAEIVFPEKKEKIFWLVSAFIWFIFLFQICATGSAFSADWMHNSYFASLLLKGDFPIHDPFQPDRLSSYHIGVPIILGALRLLTGGADTFLGSAIALITLFSIAQIFQWIIKIKSTVVNLVVCVFIPLTMIVSLGSLMVVWPYQLILPQIDNGIINWFHNLPTLSDTYNAYGAPATLDSLTLFLHRMLALSIFAALIPLILFPNRSKNVFQSSIIVILLAALVLADESVFIVTAPVIFIILFFSLFKRNVKHWTLFCLIVFAITVFQGGLVNEVLFRSDSTVAKMLLFPGDTKGPAAKFENYRSYRLEAQSSKLLQDKNEYSPFRWFHFGAVIQVSALLAACIAFTLFFKNELNKRSVLFLTWLLCLSGLTSLVAFFGIVPEGWTHINGNRFLSLSYQMSGTGITIFIIWGLTNFKSFKTFNKYFFIIAKILLLWLVIISILPALAVLFPRQKLNWFKTVINAPKTEQVWIKNNLTVDQRILPFMEQFPTAGPILETVVNAGVFTPVWYDKPEAQGFDISPPYLDLFFTQNPEILKKLKVDYVMTNKIYRSTLPAKRVFDLNNKEYFQTVYSDKDGDVVIAKILPAYFLKAENYKGTFYELSQILPSKGAFFIEQPPEISESFWRPSFLTLQMKDYKMYYSLKFIPVYNFIISVHLKFNGESSNKYDYLVLGPKTDPQSLVKNKTELFWSHIGGYVNIWKIN